MSNFSAFESVIQKLIALEDAEEMLQRVCSSRAPTRNNVLHAKAMLAGAKTRIDFASAA